MFLSMFGNAASVFLGRALARDAARVGGVAAITAVSMAIGAGVLLCAGLITTGILTGE